MVSSRVDSRFLRRGTGDRSLLSSSRFVAGSSLSGGLSFSPAFAKSILDSFLVVLVLACGVGVVLCIRRRIRSRRRKGRGDGWEGVDGNAGGSVGGRGGGLLEGSVRAIISPLPDVSVMWVRRWWFHVAGVREKLDGGSDANVPRAWDREANLVEGLSCFSSDPRGRGLGRRSYRSRSLVGSGMV